MGVMDQISDVLKQYAGGSAQVPSNVGQHFDQVAQAAPQSTVADGLAAAFRSDQTPAFGQMLSGLFKQSGGEQKAGVLNQLLASVGPSALAQLAGGGALAGMLSGGAKQITPEQAQTILPEVVQQLAAHAEESGSIHCGQSQRVLRPASHPDKDFGRGCALYRSGQSRATPGTRVRSLR
jgi:hypothetical protein